MLVIAPIVDLSRKVRSGRKTLAHGQLLTQSAINSVADASAATTLYELWITHGLSGGMSPDDFASRCQCLERWVDILYGSGMSVVMRVKARVEERRASQAIAAAKFGQVGGHISFVDPIDAFVEELSRELPPFRQRETATDR